MSNEYKLILLFILATLRCIDSHIVGVEHAKGFAMDHDVDTQRSSEIADKVNELDDLSEKSDYAFHYGVADDKNGDHHQHYEMKDGNKIIGQYEVMDADGLKRIVKYEADEKNGFQATVQRENVAHKASKRYTSVNTNYVHKSHTGPSYELKIDYDTQYRNLKDLY